MLGGFMEMGAQGIKAAFITIVGVGSIGGALLVGDISDSDILGTDPTNTIIIKNGTIPDATSDGLVFIGAQDTSGDSKSSLSLYVESDVSADATEANFSHKLPVTINGTKYWIMLTDS